MSLLNQRTCFSSGNRSLILETDPSTMDALETIADILGATKYQCECDDHNLIFGSGSSKSNEQSLDLIEMIFSHISECNVAGIHVFYQNKSFIIEGDDEKLKVLISLINVFGKDISSNEVTFSDCEKIAFNTICYVATKLGIMPAIPA